MNQCSQCGATMQLSQGPGRMRTYRGQPGLEMPADLRFYRCSKCGAEWLTSSQVEQLGDCFEAQRTARMR